MTLTKPLALASCLLLAVAAHASHPETVLSHPDSDLVLPNSPYKYQGMPDAGEFNPVGNPEEAAAHAPLYSEMEVPAPAALTYPPAVLRDVKKKPARSYALVAAPTLPCAPGYCPIRAARRDRN